MNTEQKAEKARSALMTLAAEYIGEGKNGEALVAMRSFHALKELPEEKQALFYDFLQDARKRVEAMEQAGNGKEG